MRNASRRFTDQLSPARTDKKNMLANLIAVKGEPSQLPQSLRKIKTTIYEGKQINTVNKIAKRK
jgi:hypothetical protein